MQKIYYEITKTMNNLPISICPHKKAHVKFVQDIGIGL